jgi:uncharacterized protein (TIGR02646 family)
VRRVDRPALPGPVQAYLDKRAQATAGLPNIESAWKAARQTQALAIVARTLQSMMGSRERCMYCVDSHGSDIEHFWPKVPYPGRAFLWPNMLLCCTECGRLKGIRFPLSDAGEPMLIDPSAENPWEYLDFDPETGNLTARYDMESEASSPKGEKTVQVLQLDRREGMAEGYRRTYRRLVTRVRDALAEDAIDPRQLAQDLQEIDDHGLLGWCFGPVGCRLSPFKELRHKAPDTWNACAAAVSGIKVKPR